MNPTFFYQIAAKKINNFITFDTKPSSENNIFLINRASDNVQSSFTNTEVTDGTYSTFISGTTGKITQLNYGKIKLNQSVDLNKPLLVQNTNDPFLDFNTQGMVMSGIHNLSLKRDFIFTMICNKEFNTSNQRQNFGLLSATKCYFAVQLTGNSVNVVVNATASGAMAASATKAIDNNENFRLITVTYLNSVISVYKNNVLLNNGGNAFSVGTTTTYNNIILGAKGTSGAGGAGKINKYKHFSVRTEDDLTSFDVSTYNQSVMTKYSIT